MSDFYKEVYNQDIKEQFMEEIGLEKYPPRWWERAFENSKQFEEKYGKDLHSFTAPEIIEFYKFLDVRSFESLMVYNINLIKYGNWALGNNLIPDGQNHFCEIDYDIMMRCVNKVCLNNSIMTLDEFRKIISSITNYQDKFIFYCLFEGIKGKEYSEIINLALDDLDPKNLTANITNRGVIKVSQEFMDIAIEASKENKYWFIDGKGTDLIETGFIYKDKNKTRGDNKGARTYKTIIKIIDQLGLSKYITANSIHQSGLIHYINLKAAELGITAEELMTSTERIDDRKEIVKKYNFNELTRVRFLAKYKDFLR